MFKTVLGSVLFVVTGWGAEGDLVVRLQPGAQRDLSRVLTSTDQVEVLIPEMNLVLIKPASTRSTVQLARALRSESLVQNVTVDYKMKLRSKPNDLDFSKIWSLDSKSTTHVDTEKAWDISVGGSNVLGQDIVMAVVDGGFDTTHPDLAPNLWMNKHEISGNGVDDDQNGYIDDVYGWNAFTNNGNITVDNHGTHVAGTMGAKGNNQLGVVGINWDAHLMLVNASSGDFSIVAKGYGYILKMKKLWLESKGEKGANVVVTNSSFGVDLANCQSAQYSVWNDIYNEMGKVGILSAAATANLVIDVDAKGDVPTGCESPYLISVTNTDREDKINFENSPWSSSGAAWGLKSVDLGAPGTDIYSTLPSSAYGNNTGTSMATPHVAGTVGLMHAAASSDFVDFMQRDPAAAALLLKDILLKSTDANTTLNGKTVSGGRLNVGRAVQAIHEYQKSQDVAVDAVANNN